MKRGETLWNIAISREFFVMIPKHSKIQAEKKDDLTFLSLFTVMKKQLSKWEKKKLCNQRFISP